MFQIYRIGCLAVVIAATLQIVGCASPAPNYAPSIDNVETLKKSSAGVSKVGKFAVAPDLPGGAALQLRAATKTSPVGANYGDYLGAALRQELELAKLYDATSDTEISGELLRNQVDAGGINTNEGQIDAKFQVRKSGQLRFDKVKHVEMTWESSFVGATAIPRAANNYIVLVQKLIAELFADAEFVQALRK